MEEKQIIKGKLKNSKKFKKIIRLICLLLLIILFIDTFSEAISDKISYCEYCEKHSSPTYYACRYCNESLISFWMSYERGLIYISFPIIAYILISIFIKKVWNVIELNVTNKRVYGNAILGKRVDLPLDSISSISKIKLLKGITVCTSSGKISFLFIENNDDVYNEISKLLVTRQNNKQLKSKENNNDYIAELKKLKELLDENIINQEEFDKKKKELLNNKN